MISSGGLSVLVIRAGCRLEDGAGRGLAMLGVNAYSIDVCQMSASFTFYLSILEIDPTIQCMGSDGGGGSGEYGSGSVALLWLLWAMLGGEYSKDKGSG